MIMQKKDWSKIELIVSDFDSVMTDNRVLVSADGQGIYWTSIIRWLEDAYECFFKMYANSSVLAETVIGDNIIKKMKSGLENIQVRIGNGTEEESVIWEQQYLSQ